MHAILLPTASGGGGERKKKKTHEEEAETPAERSRGDRREDDRVWTNSCAPRDVAREMPRALLEALSSPDAVLRLSGLHDAGRAGLHAGRGGKEIQHRAGIPQLSVEHRQDGPERHQ